MTTKVLRRGPFPYTIKNSVMGRYLPALAYSRRRIDLEMYAGNYSNFSGRISEEQAYKTLCDVFRLLSQPNHMQFISRLDNHLHDVLCEQQSRSSGRLLRHFITIAYLAEEASAHQIAKCLIEFFIHNRNQITADDGQYLDDWDHAIRHLARVYPCRDATLSLDHIRRQHRRAAYYRPTHYDPYDSDSDSDRGRRFHRHTHDPWRRARTMPPLYRIPPPRIAAPQYLPLPAPAGMMTSLPSPALYTADPVMEAQVANMEAHAQYVEDRLNSLEDVVVNAAVPVSPYNPLQIGYPGYPD